MGLALPMIKLRKQGIDPHGSHEEAPFLTRCTPITIFIWMFYIIFYIVNDEALRPFLLLNILDFDLAIIIGMIIVVLGYIFEGLGIYALGTNFRIELPKEESTLITGGIFKFSRNPIVLGMFFLVIGSFLMIPTIISIVLLILNVLTFDSKVRHEEKFLLNRFGEEYESYKKKVRRYL
jgi:protein-S-isoprenylcysteine O-methyltransferase Ste14